MNLEGRPKNIVSALDTQIVDVWFDGNEEIVEVGGNCPNEVCGQPFITAFTRPGINEKLYKDRFCGIPFSVVRPPFSYENFENNAQLPAVSQPYNLGVNRLA